MIPFTCPCCEVQRPPHRDDCTFSADAPGDCKDFDEVATLRAEAARLVSERKKIVNAVRLWPPSWMQAGGAILSILNEKRK